MFKVQSNNTIKRKIIVRFPSESGETKGSFMAEMNLIPQSELEDLLDEPESVQIERILASVGDVGDDDGNPLPADKALEAIKQNTNAVSAVLGDYMEVAKGYSFRGGKKRR